MAGNKTTPNYKRICFKLFERDGEIMISLQMLLSHPDEKYEQVIEYYVAKEQRNVKAIIDTLVDTRKNFTFVDGNLQSTYRKNDTFIIEDYEHIKYHPELQKFVHKFQKRIDKIEKAHHVKNLQVSKNRRKFLMVRNITGLSTIIGGTALIAWLSSEPQVVQAIKGVQNESLEETDLLVEENIEDDTIDVFQSGLEEIARSTIEDLAEIEQQHYNELEQVQEMIEEESMIEDELEEDIEGEDETELTSEEIDAEIEAIARQLVEEEKTSEEEIALAAAEALEGGQAVSEETVIEEPITEIVPVMNSEGTGINYIATYNLTPEQIDVIKAVVQHEAGFVDEKESYATMSAVINRCEVGTWKGGSNPYNVIVASWQFQSYYEGHYKKYLNGNYSEYTSQIVDQMLSGEVLPFHDFESFGSGPDATGTQFTKKGNKYH